MEFLAHVTILKGLPSLPRILLYYMPSSSNILSSATLSLTTCFDPSDLDCLSPLRAQVSVSVYSTAITHFTFTPLGCFIKPPVFSSESSGFGLLSGFPSSHSPSNCGLKPSFSSHPISWRALSFLRGFFVILKRGCVH